MSIRFSIKADTDQMYKKLDNLARRQIPFAVARAVTQTAVKVRNEDITREYMRTFEARNLSFIMAVHRVYGANVSFAKRTGVAVASIQPVDDPVPTGTTASAGGSRQGTTKTRAGTQFMKRHVKGGIKASGRTKLAIPVTGAKLTRRRSGSMEGAMTKASKPKQVLARKNTFIGTSKRTGNSMIMQRTGKGKNAKVNALYTLSSSAKIKRVYDPLPAAKRGIARTFPSLFRKSFVGALRTAKIRA
jgi:hypothetical protein